MKKTDLKKEAEEMTTLLKGKTVATVWRHRNDEVAIEFTDGTRIFIDRTADGFEFSIT